MLELALIENLQRKDLTPFEESEALQGLADSCGYTHEDLARRLGKSRTSITESLALTAMPEEVRNLCRLADISSKSLLLQVVRQDTPEKMTALIEKIASQGGATRQQLREAAAKPKAGPAEALRVCLPAADQGVQPEALRSRKAARRGTSHRRARGDPQRTPQNEIGRARLAWSGVVGVDQARDRNRVRRRGNVRGEAASSDRRW